MYSINLLAVIVAAAANMLIGFIWYQQKMFGKAWRKLNNFSKARLKKMKNVNSSEPYVMTAIGSLVTSYVLNYLIQILNLTSIHQGILLAALMWAGFSASTQLADYMFSDRPKNLFSLVAMQNFFGFIVMGAILAAMV